MATDVAARGLDIDDIDCVIQFHVRHVDSLVHRTGRTGRAGKAGTNIIFSDVENLEFIQKCESSLNIKVKYQNSLVVKDPKEEEDKLQRICAGMVSEKSLRRHKPKVAKYSPQVEQLM